MEINLQPDDPEEHCPICGDRIPDGEGIPATTYDKGKLYHQWYCSRECVIAQLIT